MKGAMVAKMNDIAVGENWAYRVGGTGDPVEVEVRELGTEKPARVLVSFAADREEWVSPARLKVRWAERASFLDAEAGWVALSSEPDEIERHAVEMLFVEFILPAAKLNDTKARRGTVTITDFDLADVFVGGALEQVVAGAPSVAGDEGESYGWSTALEMARQLCRTKTQRVMAFIHAQEAEGRRPGATESDISFYEEYTRPACDLLRSWSGAGAAKVHDDLHWAREEVSRLAALLVDGSRLLSRAGAVADSWSLYSRAFPSDEEIDWKVAISIPHLNGRKPTA